MSASFPRNQLAAGDFVRPKVRKKKPHRKCEIAVEEVGTWDSGRTEYGGTYFCHDMGGTSVYDIAEGEDVHEKHSPLGAYVAFKH